MTANLESRESETGPPPTSSSTGKRITGKKPEAAKKKYGRMTFRLPLNYEHALLLATVQLERAGEEIHTLPQMIEQALERYTDYLQVKKNVDFLGIVPKKILPSK